MINSALNTATSGLITTGLATNVRANNTTNMLTPEYTSQQPQRITREGGGVDVVAKPGGPVELTHEMVGLLQEEHSFKANAATFRTADEMYQEAATLKD